MVSSGIGRRPEFESEFDISNWLKKRDPEYCYFLSYRAGIRSLALLNAKDFVEPKSIEALRLCYRGLAFAQLFSQRGVASELDRIGRWTRDLTAITESVDFPEASKLIIFGILRSFDLLNSEDGEALADIAASACYYSVTGGSRTFGKVSDVAIAHDHLFSRIEIDAEFLDSRSRAWGYANPLYEKSYLPAFYAPKLEQWMSSFSEETIPPFLQNWLNSVCFRTDFENWDLLQKIIEIPDEFWASNSVVLADELKRILAEHTIAKTPVAEDVFYNEETARFGREPRPILQHERHEAVLISVRDAVEAASTGNYLHAGEYHIRTLSKMLETNSKHPHVIEQKLVRVARSLRKEMAKPDGLPDTPEIEGLAEVCDENAIEMRALYPEVAKARAEKSAQRVKEASAEERQALDDAKDVIEQITEPEFGAEIVDDIDTIRETSEMADAGRGEVDADAVGRTGNRLAKIWLLTKKIAKGTVIGGGAVIVGAEGIAAINEALPILLRLLGL